MVRNPYDTIVSYFNLFSQKNHTDTVPEEIYEKFAHLWQLVIEENSKYIPKFYQFWKD